jgi:hypothetical protein
MGYPYLKSHRQNNVTNLINQLVLLEKLFQFVLTGAADKVERKSSEDVQAKFSVSGNIYPESAVDKNWNIDNFMSK